MADALKTTSELAARSNAKFEEKLLVSRREAAARLSISKRAIDYLNSNNALTTRRIGTRVLIPTAELRRFANADHPERLAS